MHRVDWAAAVALLVGCTPAAQNARPKAPSPEPLTWKARAVFDSALQARDTARIGSLLAPGAFVISPAGDTLPAHGAVATYLAQAGENAVVRFSWGREGSLEECVGGAREQLIYTARLTRPVPDSSSSAMTGRVAVFWQPDTAGSLKIAWIAFPEQERARKLTRAECASVDEAVWRSWRWAFSLYLRPAFVGGVKGSFESALRAQGFTDLECSCRSPSARYTPISDWATDIVPVLTVQRHLNGRWVGELAVGSSPHGTTVGARFFPNRDYSKTQLWYSGGFLQTVFSYEHWPFQLGAGAVVQLSSWRLQDSVIPYSTGGYPSATVKEWSSTAPGLVGDLRYNMLVGRRAFLTFRGQVIAYPSVRTPATSHFAAATVNPSAAFFGIGVGLLR